jgi:hypothetical protein
MFEQRGCCSVEGGVDARKRLSASCHRYPYIPMPDAMGTLLVDVRRSGATHEDLLSHLVRRTQRVFKTYYRGTRGWNRSKTGFQKTGAKRPVTAG